MSFNHSQTSNGINVVTYNMPYVNSVAINIIVNVGSRFELPQESGMSHFLEHMAFKGTKKRTALDIAKEFDAIGGHFNAYTSRENTVYFTKVLHQHCNHALEIMADILQNSVFSEQEIKRELDVITQEIAEVQDSPDDLVYEKFYPLSYPDQAIGRSILGTVDNIKNFTSADFQSYINKHYTTNNIVISIAGKINHKQATDLVDNLFNSLSTSNTNRSYEAANYAGGELFIEKQLEQTSIAIGFEAPSYQNVNDFYHAQILSIIFGGGLSSRLFQKIREELGLAYSVGSWQNSFSDSGIFSIYSSCEHAKADELISNIYNEITKIQKDISENELERAKSQIEANIYMAEEKPEYKSEEIGKHFAIFKNYLPCKEVINLINQTKIEDLLRISNKIFASPLTLVRAGVKCENQK